MPSLASGHRHRCDLTIDIRRLYRSRHCAGPSYMSRRASCAHGAQCPSLASGRRRRCALAVHIGRLHYRSRHRAGQSVKSRRHCAGPSYMSRRASCAHGAQCPSLASGRRRRCALAVHIGRLHYRSRHRAGQSVKSRRAVCAHGRSVKSRRARCALMVLDALFGIRPPPPLSSRRPHRTFVYRSRHRAEQSCKSRRAHCALMVLDAPFGVGPPRRRCALAVHIGRLYTALAIAQGDRHVETRSMRSWFSMPSFASDPPSLSSRRPPLGRLYRSCHRTERFFKSRRAHRALMVLDALFGV